MVLKFLRFLSVLMVLWIQKVKRILVDLNFLKGSLLLKVPEGSEEPKRSFDQMKTTVATAGKDQL